jgi:hypothetical protein
MLASTLGTIVLLLFGSAALVAGSLNWQAASSRGGDAEQAREAAEWGFNTLVDRLNNDSHHYLLATNWPENSSSWAAVNNGNLNSCSIKSTGANTNAQVINEIISQTISQTQPLGANRRIRYRLISFRPPQFPGATTADANCQMFGNLAGGTARLTVVGEVLPNDSETPLTSYQLIRDITVENMSLSGGSSSSGPGVASPALPFLATGSGDGNKLESGANIYYDTATPLWQGTSADTRATLACLHSCSKLDAPSAYKNAAANLSTEDFLKSLPSRPPYNSELDALPKGCIQSDNFSQDRGKGDCSSNSERRAWQHFPFASSSGSDLLPYCKQVPLTTTVGTQSFTENVIGCRVQILEPENSGDFTVHTDRTNLPVVIYLTGNSDDFQIDKNRAIINKRFRDTRNTDPGSWNRLRIYGDPSTDAKKSFTITSDMKSDDSLKKCTNNDKQVLKFGENSQVDGAFMWIPKGEITFDGKPVSPRYSYYGVVWGCKVEFKTGYIQLLGTSAQDAAQSIDAIFGRVPALTRFVARGVERSL